MNEYDAINDEIKNFLTLADKKPEKETVPEREIGTSRDEMSSLIALLTSLQSIYSEINTNLAAGDNEGVKSTVLESDVKMSLVCESLMRVLKDVCEEKSELVSSEERSKERIKKLVEEKEGLEMRMSRMESDLEFTSRGNQELSRIIKDQKNKIQGFKEKADLEKRNCDSFRSINEELEILRRKALEKCEVYEKEIEAVKGYLKEKGSDVVRMKEAVRQMEAEKEEMNRKMVGMEKDNELLRKKLEMKESALGVCNSELSKLISKEKRMEGEMEGLRERMSYYERLYKATNNQNEYLNRQLSRMIKVEGVQGIPEYSEGMEECKVSEKEDTRSSDRKYIRRLRRYKRRTSEQRDLNEKQRAEIEDMSVVVSRLREENNRLKDEKVRAIDYNRKMTDELMKKVEGLLEKNREYQTAIYELKGLRRREGGEARDGLEGSRTRIDFDESFKTVNDGEDTHVERNEYSISRRPARYEERRETKPLVLLNDYGDADGEHNRHDVGRKRMEGHSTDNIRSRLGASEKDEGKDRPEIGAMRLNLPDGFYRSLTGNNTKRDRDEMVGSERYPADPFNSVPNGGYVEDVSGGTRSNESTTSPRTVHTTSTLHEMLRRTDALQEKFRRLEDQLNVIKESDRNDAEKVQEQIKAYKNYYYSDYLDMSNKSDVI